MQTRKKVIVHINNISAEVMELILQKYPDGYQDHIFKVTKPNNDFFHAITVDTPDTSYLIKVDVKIDNVTADKIDEQIFSAVENIDENIIPEEDKEEEKKSKKSDEVD